MFNAYVFLQSLLFLSCLSLVVVNLFVVLRHTWLPVRIGATIAAILALAAAIGVLCA